MAGGGYQRSPALGEEGLLPYPTLRPSTALSIIAQKVTVVAKRARIARDDLSAMYVHIANIVSEQLFHTPQSTATQSGGVGPGPCGISRQSYVTHKAAATDRDL